jgi:hypothetical protein
VVIRIERSFNLARVQIIGKKIPVITWLDRIGFARGDPWELGDTGVPPRFPSFQFFCWHESILKFRSNYVKYTVAGLKLRSPANAEIEYAGPITGRTENGKCGRVTVIPSPQPQKNRLAAEPPRVLQVARCYENIRQFREETMQFLTKTVPK